MQSLAICRPRLLNAAWLRQYAYGQYPHLYPLTLCSQFPQHHFAHTSKSTQKHSRNDQSKAKHFSPRNVDTFKSKIDDRIELRDIILPQTKLGHKAYGEAKNLWLKVTEKCTIEQSRCRGQVEAGTLRIRLLFSSNVTKTLVHLHPPGITFDNTHQLGARLLRVESGIEAPASSWLSVCIRAIGALTVVCLVWFWSAHREEVPITKRRRFNILRVTESQLNPSRSDDDVIQVLPQSHSITTLVQGVLDKLLSTSDLKELDANWRLILMSIPEVINCCVSPGGTVFMTTGLLPACQDEDGVAFVLGHEIGHVLAGHAVEAMSRLHLLCYSIPAWPAAISMGRLVSRSKVFLGVYVGSIVFGVMGLDAWLGRNRESEADYIGLYITAKARYDVRKVVDFYERLDSRQQEILDFYRSRGENFEVVETAALWQTHPPTATRVRQLKAWLPQVIDRTNWTPPQGTAKTLPPKELYATPREHAEIKKLVMKHEAAKKL